MLDQRTIPLTFLISILFLLWGCASSPRAIEQPEQLQQKTSIEEYERTFNPSKYNEPIAATTTREKSATLTVTLPEDSLQITEEVVQGYRVQVYSSSNFDEASQMKSLVAEQASSDSVYILFDPPVYKVRVGDYPTRYEANQRLLFFLNAGYRDAWIVPDRIVLRKRYPSQSTETQ